jgi:acyl-CoA synthetase (AMP-forming)/AMP-acid ligase II
MPCEDAARQRLPYHPRMNLASLLHQAATRHPLAFAVTQDRQSWGYAEFSHRVAATAGYLRGVLGCRPGDRVALAMHNSPGFLQALWGCWHAGLCAVPMNAKLHPRELAYILEHSGASVCLTSSKLYDGIREACGTLPALCMLDAHPRLFDAMAAAPPMPPHAGRPTDPAWLFYTSGTTGRPKGATLTQRNLTFMTLAYFADVDALDQRDTIVHAAPLSHGSGIYCLPHFAKGSHNVITASESFSPGEMLECIERYANVSFFAAPTMVVRLMQDGSAGQARLDHLKCIMYGGAPMYLADLERALDLFGPRLYQIYGQGESPMTITGLSKADHARALAAGDRTALGSAGAARTGVEVRMVDDADRELPDGEPGEIVTRSDCVMAGYWRDPAEDERALRGGWLHTGDVGVRDVHGRVTLKDRSKDLIISGGSNIYPREIEDVLLRDARVAQASVVGAPHPEWGEEVVAFVVAQPQAQVTAAELDALCLEHVARFKRPRRYVFVDELPKNNYGKVLKRELRERLTQPPGDPS